MFQEMVIRTNARVCSRYRRRFRRGLRPGGEFVFDCFASGTDRSYSILIRERDRDGRSGGALNFTFFGSGTVIPLGNATFTGSGKVTDVTSIATSPTMANLTFDFGGGNTMTGTLSIPAGIVVP